MISRISYLIRRLRIFMSRSEWAVRHFRFSRSMTSATQPGLALIQIDGLSQAEMQRAMEAGQLPFLKSLIDTETYQVAPLYSGLPSSTPAVQAELFYGVKNAIPAFCYYDETCGRIFSMFEGDDAREIEKRLAASGEPLLRDGSAYCDMYNGGASEAHLCMTKFGWPEFLRNASPPIVGLLALLHIPSVIRILVLFVVELFVALVDLFRGLIEKQNFWAELKFIPSRVAVSIVMREFMVMRSGIDLLRGLPIVHMNFLGYDEQAHRRGPDSTFAHWSLKGIDDAIKRVHKAARRSMSRDYDVWIYSDHGQVKTKSYQTKTGETVQSAVSRVFDKAFSSREDRKHGIQIERAQLLHAKRRRPETQPPVRLPIVTGVGPLGCIYLGNHFPDDERRTMAERLVREASIPMVMARSGEQQAMAWTPSGCYQMPRDAAAVLGPEHPFLEEAARDLVRLCHHKDAGDFLISGWAHGQEPLSFPMESGAHGGATPEETCAFSLLPEDAPLPKDVATLRLTHIRGAVQSFLAGHRPVAIASKAILPVHKPLRLLTYNVHSCVGMDGAISPHRIARVIEREAPDIIALQEVDVGRERTESEDQARILARYLGMHFHFHPAMQLEEEQYGDAILSRFPMTVRRAAALPYRKHWLVDEPRGALWVEIDLGHARHLQLVNTHLGLGRRERREQAEALLGPDWLGHADCRGAVILCGDLNSSPSSRVHRMLCTGFQDVQRELEGHRRLKTFMGRHPFGYLDHVLINDRLEIRGVSVPGHLLARIASDHLPLVVDLALANPRHHRST